MAVLWPVGLVSGTETPVGSASDTGTCVKSSEGPTGLRSSIILLISLAFEPVALSGSPDASRLSSSSAGNVIAHGFSCSSELLGIPPTGETPLFLNVPRPATGLLVDSD